MAKSQGWNVKILRALHDPAIQFGLFIILLVVILLVLAPASYNRAARLIMLAGFGFVCGQLATMSGGKE